MLVAVDDVVTMELAASTSIADCRRIGRDSGAKRKSGFKKCRSLACDEERTSVSRPESSDVEDDDDDDDDDDDERILTTSAASTKKCSI